MVFDMCWFTEIQGHEKGANANRAALPLCPSSKSQDICELSEAEVIIERFAWAGIGPTKTIDFGSHAISALTWGMSDEPISAETGDVFD
jgi:hypothetical protein